jgi:hypothetical protein
MRPERSRHIESAFRVTTLAVVLALLLGPVADLLCRSVCDARSAARSGCHHHDADGRLVAAALPPDARPLDSRAGSWCQVGGRPSLHRPPDLTPLDG